jgi:hypothetical protein
VRSLPARAGLVLIVFVVLAVGVAVRGVLSSPQPGSAASIPVPTDTLASDGNGSSLAAGSTASATGAAPTSSELPQIDTASWPTLRLHTLGYSLQLPPSFEVIGDDPDNPVPSIDAIASLSPAIADGIRTQAQRLDSQPGVFGELGLWSVEPTTLSQVGLLAGEPYRVASSDLKDIVSQAAAARATPLEGTSIDEIQIPAGNGYLVGYRDESDLGAHREIHVRTPTGRYLVLVMTVPTPTISAADEQRFLAIAGSLAPLEGADSGEVPAPSAAPDGHSDPALEALLPDSVGGVTLEKRSANGEDLVGGQVGSGTVLDAVGALVPVPGDVTVALAVPSTGSSNLVLTAFSLRGVDNATIAARMAEFPSEIWSTQTVGGRSVLASVPGSDGRRTYLRLSGNVLEEVVTDNAAEAAEVIAALG